MEKFLKKYYKQLHFNSMPEGVQARFYEWVKNGTLTQAMQHWTDEYLQHDAHNNLIVINNEYIPNNLPHPNNTADLSDEDAKQLFVAFHKAFSKMNAKLSKIEKDDPQSAKFVKDYFGPGKLFEQANASSTCIAGIDDIRNLLTTNVNLQGHVLRQATDNEGKKLFNTPKDFTDFMNDCRTGKYNSDPSVQSKIVSVANFLADAEYNSSIPDTDKAAIANIINGINNVLADDAFTLNIGSINNTKLNEFRQIWAPKAYDQNQPGSAKQGLLQTLYYNKNIRSKFAEFDGGEITKHIDGAESEVNWQDKSKENYVDPKIDDVLTPMQQIKKWATDTYNDTFRKYEQLRGGSVFFKQEARYIFDAIDKCKVKPTDGLDALLNKKDEIEGKINNPVARQHFKWFTETMKPIADKMPQAIKGAWNNSTQQKAIIRRIILEATKPGADPDAVEKAKTAMIKKDRQR